MQVEQCRVGFLGNCLDVPVGVADVWQHSANQVCVQAHQLTTGLRHKLLRVKFRVCGGGGGRREEGSRSMAWVCGGESLCVVWCGDPCNQLGSGLRRYVSASRQWAGVLRWCLIQNPTTPGVWRRPHLDPLESCNASELILAAGLVHKDGRQRHPVNSGCGLYARGTQQHAQRYIHSSSSSGRSSSARQERTCTSGVSCCDCTLTLPRSLHTTTPPPPVCQLTAPSLCLPLPLSLSHPPLYCNSHLL